MERIILQFQKNESKLQKKFTSDVKTTFQLGCYEQLTIVYYYIKRK